MKFNVLTLFPEMIESASAVSIMGRAVSSGAIEMNIVNIRDFSVNKHNRVDDYPYGGGAGMVMEAEPVYRAVNSVLEQSGKNLRVIYLTPQAPVLNQTKVEELARLDEMILLCGHYEGIDERVLEEVVTDYISIGDYVLTGGELGALVLMDAVSRFVPGVLSNEESAQFESLQDNLLEYPHYTRPEKWRGKGVPTVLLSGDHKEVEKWRYDESVKRTRTRRPDLLKNSYHIHTLMFGGDDTVDAAAAITTYMSRYGELLNYNRARLRKETRELSASDLVIFVTDSDFSDGIPLEDVCARLKGNHTLLAAVTFGGAQGLKGDAAFEKMLKDKGFRLIRHYSFAERPDDEALKDLTLEIRGILN